ncbi:DUF1064 domain-containing protein [Caballeronia sp. LZ025]|uniref:DUF1064 domain-containing protein n=1 Tax=Caballeronia TaxID=1827195 RepID=UPI001FD3C403|nr:MULTISPECIES: DUF1064 domain-containing protein [Caballeronia]MDR5736153.1 DUF1064 domain-containing protein [Caballeronia sp. LZ025]
MTKRSAPWPLYVPEGTKNVGTARVREGGVPAMTTAQRRIYEKTGVPPQTAALDDPLDPFAGPAVITGKAKKPTKYRNTKCEADGIKFDSLRERARWFELIQQQARGEIAKLELQVPFVLAEPVVIGGRKRPALRYVADFVYERAGERVIEDVKGRITEGYRIKRHLMAARGLTIVEIK